MLIKKTIFRSKFIESILILLNKKILFHNQEIKQITII
jgi:hypothetical protein